jgi:replicative DNA helicase
VPTGFFEIDRLTSGLQPAELIIIAGRPSMGKSALATNIAQHAAAATRKPVAMFSLEMSKESLVLRMLCSEARVDSTKVRTGYLSEQDFPRLAMAAGRLADLPFFIDDSPAISVLELRAKARRLMRESGLGLIIVDYLQLMRAHKDVDNREQEISLVSRSLKALAKELNVPVVALSQLNRAVEQRADKRPLMADLRESGAIEQDADVIAFIYRDDFYNRMSQEEGVAEIIIAKQRNGPQGVAKLHFRKEFTLFENLSQREEMGGGDDDDV